MAGHSSIAHWTSPIRALRNACGWRPARIPLVGAKYILVVRPDEIGDVVLTIPFLRELRRAAPEAKIALIVKPACYELVEHCPYVDTVQVLKFRSGGDRHYRLLLVFAAWRLRWNKFARWKFDLILLPRRSSDSYGSDLVGHVFAGSGALIVHREQQGSFPAVLSKDRSLASSIYSNPEIEHEVMHNLHFLRWCGTSNISAPALELWVTATDRRFAADVLHGHRGWVAFATGAGDRARQWPIERFSEIAKWLQDSSGLTPVLLGAAGDPEFDGGLNLIGRTSLRQAAAVVEQCVLYVGNDSGLMHMAAAMGVPVVEISGFRIGSNPNHYNSPDRFSPFGVPHRIVQPSIGQNALAIEEVTIDAVRIACSELLSGAVAKC